MRAKLAPELQMTIEEFLAFTASRPDEERWELIEGGPVMNASPVDDHQVIAGNILAHLVVFQVKSDHPWRPSMGIGTRVPLSPNAIAGLRLDAAAGQRGSKRRPPLPEYPLRRTAAGRCSPR